jgi:pyroglutamyl-peptidase
MKTKILLTSFQTWLPHQKSNSSDDLLKIIQKKDNYNFVSLFFLRNLPVDIDLASQKVIAEIQTIQPHIVICFGMAESRSKLTLESNATCQDECLYTSVDLVELNRFAMLCEISENAGKFVCEGLYYQILKHLQSLEQNIHCIFIHVPLLRQNNMNLILHDFYSIIHAFAFKLLKITKTN